MKKGIIAYAESAWGVIRQEFVRVFCGYRWYLTVILIVVIDISMAIMKLRFNFFDNFILVLQKNLRK